MRFEIVDLEEDFNKAMQIIAMDIQEALKGKLTKEHGKDTGELQSGIRTQVNGDVITISMPEHGEYIEFGCFFDNETMILTPEGQKMLKDLNIGDYVYNSEMKKKKVIQKERLDIGYDVEEITIHTGRDTLVVTADHPINTKCGWKRAGELTEGDEVYIHGV